MNYKKYCAYIFILISVFLVSCGGGEEGKEQNNLPDNQTINNYINLTLDVNIKDNNGYNLANADIQIWQNDIKISNFTSDNLGNFKNSIKIIKNSKIDIKILKPNYTTYTRNLGLINQDTNIKFSVNSFKNTYIEDNLAYDKTININNPNALGAEIILTPNTLVDMNNTLNKNNIKASISLIDPAMQPQALISIIKDNSMYSLGLAKFEFTTNDNSQLHINDKIEVNIPLFGLYNQNKQKIKLDDKIDLWYLDTNNQWKNDGSGKVIYSANSPTKLAIKAEIHNSFWYNLSFADTSAINKIEKSIQINTTNISIDNLELNAIFRQVVAGKNKYAHGLTYIFNQNITNNAIISIPAGFDMEILPSTNLENKYSLKPIYLESDKINNTENLNLSIQNNQSNLSIFPNKTFNIQKGTTIDINYYAHNIDTSLKWYVDNIEGGNTTIGLIKNGRYIATNNAGIHTIKVSNSTGTISQSVNIKVVENLIIADSGVSVLMYHKIEDLPANSPNEYKTLFTTAQSFAQQMEYIATNNFTSLFSHEILNYTKYDKPIVITFDDGWENTYYSAFPMLKKYNIKATMFIIANNVNKKNYLKDWQIKEILDSGLVSIQNHTLNHIDLTSASLEQLNNEISMAKDYLQKTFAIKVNTIAYPHGYFNENVIDATIKYQHNFGFIVKFNKFYISEILTTKDLLSINRQAVNYDINIPQFADIINY